MDRRRRQLYNTQTCMALISSMSSTMAMGSTMEIGSTMGMGSTIGMGSTMEIGTTMGMGGTMVHTYISMSKCTLGPKTSEGTEEKSSLIDLCLRRR